MELLNRENLREVKFLTRSDYGKKVAILGSGTFGEVSLYLKANGEQVAVKSFFGGVDEQYSDAIREISLMRRCNHPCVMKLIDVIDFKAEENFSLELVMEIGAASLWDSYKSIDFANYESTISVTRVEKTMYHLAAGLSYLHDNDIVHRDLKPGNIILTADGRTLISDLGAGRCGVIKGGNYSLPVQTLWWRAPEVAMMKIDYDPKKADVYSLGIIFTELWYGRALFAGVENETQLLVKEAMTFKNMTAAAWPEAEKLSPDLFKTGALEDLAGKPEIKGVFTLLKQRPGIYKHFQKWEELVKDMVLFDPSKRPGAYRVLNYQGFDSLRDPFIEDYADLNHKCGKFLEQYSLEAQALNYELHFPGAPVNLNQLNILSNWMFEAASEYHLDNSTIQHFYHLLMLFLQKEQAAGYPVLVPKNFQLIGCVCIFISANLCETYALGIDDLVYISGSSFTREEFKVMLAYVFRKVEFNFTYSLPIQFVDNLYTTASPFSKKTNYLCSLLLGLNVKEKDPKLMAYAASYLLSKAEGVPYPSCIENYLSEVQTLSKDYLETLLKGKNNNMFKMFVDRLEKVLVGGITLESIDLGLAVSKRKNIEMSWSTVVKTVMQDPTREFVAQTVKDMIYYKAVEVLNDNRVRERDAFMNYFNIAPPLSGKGGLIIPAKATSKIVMTFGKIQKETTVKVLFKAIPAVLEDVMESFILTL